MRFKPLAEFSHRRADIAARLEGGNEGVQVLVVEQCSNQQLASLRDVDHEREELFFLLAEVRHARRAKEAEKCRRSAGRIVGSVSRPAQPPRFDEGVVMVVRERNQGLMPLHPRNLAAPWLGTGRLVIPHGSFRSTLGRRQPTRAYDHEARS